MLAAACAVLAMLVVLLSWQNHRIKADAAIKAVLQAPPDLPAAGDAVAPFEVVGDDGSPVEIAFENSGDWTVMLLFTLECPACLETLPLWREFVDDADASGARIVGLRLDESPGGPPTGNLHAGLGFPVYLVGEEPPEFMRGALSVPATLIIDDRGTIATAIYGVPSNGEIGSILQTLSQGV